VLAFYPDVIGIASTSPSHKAALDMAKKLKTYLPNLPIVKGGVHETYCGSHTLENFPQVDYGMVGEVEQSFCLLLAALNRECPLESVPGLLYRGQGGIVKRGPPVSLPSHLDEIPIANRDLLGEDLSIQLQNIPVREDSAGADYARVPIYVQFLQSA
jgi:hypothetical protein